MTAATSEFEAATTRTNGTIQSIPDEGGRRYIADALELIDSKTIPFLALVQETRRTVIPDSKIHYVDSGTKDRQRVVVSVTGAVEDTRYYVVTMHESGAWSVQLSDCNRLPSHEIRSEAASCFEAFAWIATDARTVPAASDTEDDRASRAALGRNIKNLCRAHGLSVKELAGRVAPDIDRSQEPPILRMVGITNGWQQATTEDIAAIARAFGVTPETLRVNWETKS